MRRCAVIAGLFVLLAHSAPARLMRSWSYRELFAASDFVVIATPASRTHDTGEHNTLSDVGMAVSGVETEFRALLVLKGAQRSRFTLHHYRLTREDVALVDAPMLVSFVVSSELHRYLLFLTRERDGRFAPTGGQTDPFLIGVQELSGVIK